MLFGVLRRGCWIGRRIGRLLWVNWLGVILFQLGLFGLQVNHLYTKHVLDLPC